MLRFRRGDILYIDLKGGVGVEKQKERPCVVVQNDRGNTKAPFTIVVPLTDASTWKSYREQVLISASELGQGGKDSVISCGEIRQVDRSRINEGRGVWARLSPETLRKVDDALRAALALEHDDVEPGLASP